MNEIRGFLQWQFDQIRNAKVSDWLYFLAVFMGIYAGIAPTSTTVIFGITLDIWGMAIAGIYLIGYIVYQIMRWQYGIYQREKETIARELGKK